MSDHSGRSDNAADPRLDVVNAGLSRRGFLGAGAAAGAGLLLAGCGGGKSAGDTGTSSGKKFTGTYTGPHVALAYWNGFTGGDGPHMRKMVDDFNAKNPKIKVTMNTIQWSDFYQKLPAAVLAGKGPDVAIMHEDQLSTFAARKTIIPLDDVVTELKFQESDFIPAIWKAGIYQGKRFGIPLDVHSLAQYYNKASLQKAGLTTLPDKDPDFSSSLDKLSAAGVGQPFWMPVHWPSHLMFLSLLWQNGGEPYDTANSKATFDSDAGMKALTWMVDQVKKGRSPKNVAADSQYTAFKNGKDAVTWDGIWQINDLKSTTNGLSWDLSFIPQIGDTLASWSNSHNFVLPKAKGDDNKVLAAKAFISYISKQSLEWAKSGMIPARNSVRDSPEFKTLPQAKIAEHVDALHFMPQIPGIGDVGAQTLEVAVQKAVLGQQDPKTALSSAAGQASKLMEANKSKFGG